MPYKSFFLAIIFAILTVVAVRIAKRNDMPVHLLFVLLLWGTLASFLIGCREAWPKYVDAGTLSIIFFSGGIAFFIRSRLFMRFALEKLQEACELQEGYNAKMEEMMAIFGRLLDARISLEEAKSVFEEAKAKARGQ